MRLNLPNLEELSRCRNLLLVGIGSGFDLFCALPLYFELTARGQRVHLANVSYQQNLAGAPGTQRLTPRLVGLTAACKGPAACFPEVYLSQWFREKQRQDVPVWYFEMTGVRPLLEDYRALVKHLGVDGILLIDGGIDSLVRGDETSMATVLEDALSLAAVSCLGNVRLRQLVCLGFGAEQEVDHAQAFESIAALAREGAFLGSCSLTRQMASYQKYEEAVAWTHRQPGQSPSVINASVVSAVNGRFGDFHLTEKTRGSRLWISPLMPMYWFFDVQAVANRNLFLSTLLGTNTYDEAVRVFTTWVQSRKQRPEIPIGLP